MCREVTAGHKWAWRHWELRLSLQAGGPRTMEKEGPLAAKSNIQGVWDTLPKLEFNKFSLARKCSFKMNSYAKLQYLSQAKKKKTHRSL